MVAVPVAVARRVLLADLLDEPAREPLDDDPDERAAPVALVEVGERVGGVRRPPLLLEREQQPEPVLDVVPDPRSSSSASSCAAAGVSTQAVSLGNPRVSVATSCRL